MTMNDDQYCLKWEIFNDEINEDIFWTANDQRIILTANVDDYS